MVACRSWTLTRPSAALKPNSSVAPWAMPALHPAAGQPHGEPVVVVVAAVAVLRHRGAAELPAPDDERVVQQPALPQVLQQGRDRAVDLAALLLQLGVDPGVVVPPAERQLHEPDAALDQPPGQQAAAGELARPVRLAHPQRLAAGVERLPGGGLHPERRLHRPDAGLQLRVVPVRRGVGPVERLQRVELPLLVGRGRGPGSGGGGSSSPGRLPRRPRASPGTGRAGSRCARTRPAPNPPPRETKPGRSAFSEPRP